MLMFGVTALPMRRLRAPLFEQPKESFAIQRRHTRPCGANFPNASLHKWYSGMGPSDARTGRAPKHAQRTASAVLRRKGGFPRFLAA